MNKPIYIIGTGLSHDGSTCLMKDGKIIVAIEKERLTKKKHDGFNDNLTIEYCLNSAGITFDDISLIVQENTYNPDCKPEEILKRKGRNIPSHIKQITISHHLAHAYSAIGTSPFEEMSVMVIDGQGSSLDQCIDIPTDYSISIINDVSDKKQYWEFLSCYSFKDGKLKTLHKEFGLFNIWDRKNFPAAPEDMLNSIGEFYDGISNYIFDKSFCDGKTMGLASYGKPGIYNFDAFDFNDGQVKLKHDWIKKFDKYSSGKYQGFSENFQFFADIAFWAQKQLEQIVYNCFNNLYIMSPHENVSYSGGVALNAVLNSKLLNKTKFKNVYIQPAAGDNGLALGCCYYGWLEYFKKPKVSHNRSTYFGRSYGNSETLEILEKYKDILVFEETDDYVDKAAKFLNESKVLGWFQDGAEFGPRALGNRSILADPSRKDIRNFINRKIKTREDFRPFAPSILKEELHNYFECNFDESDYMLKIATVNSDVAARIPGVVHKDLTARVQTVDKNIIPKFYNLISKFYELSNLPIVLNTSFNGNNMPIVETPEDAISFFINIKYIDILVINNIIIRFIH